MSVTTPKNLVLTTTDLGVARLAVGGVQINKIGLSSALTDTDASQTELDGVFNFYEVSIERSQKGLTAVFNVQNSLPVSITKIGLYENDQLIWVIDRVFNRIHDAIFTLETQAIYLITLFIDVRAGVASITVNSYEADGHFACGQTPSNPPDYIEHLPLLSQIISTDTPNQLSLGRDDKLLVDIDVSKTDFLAHYLLNRGTL